MPAGREGLPARTASLSLLSPRPYLAGRRQKDEDHERRNDGSSGAPDTWYPQALANKLARRLWAMDHHGTPFDPRHVSERPRAA